MKESKVFCTSDLKRIKHYEGFGWELLCIDGSQIAMTRDTTRLHYNDLCNMEQEYEALLREYNSLVKPETQNKFNLATFIICLVFFIIPGIIYAIACSTQRGKDDEKLKLYAEKRAELMSKMDQLCDNARVVARAD